MTRWAVTRPAATRRVMPVTAVVLAIGAGIGVAAAATPADALPATASFTATDFAWNVSGHCRDHHLLREGGSNLGHPPRSDGS